jgi:small-conductance mechanosensitive channel
MNIEQVKTKLLELQNTIIDWAFSPQFYAQAAAIVCALILASIFSVTLKKRLQIFREPPQAGTFLALRNGIYALKSLLFPICSVIFLAVAIQITMATVDQDWLVRIAQSLAVVTVLYVAIKQFISNTFISCLFRWVGIPIATLHVFGWLGDAIKFLDSIAFEVGDIRLSAYALVRVFVVGSILFWLGRISNKTGQQVIREHESLNARTREIFAKLYEIVLYVVIFLLLLQVVGLDLTALAVFGGALGVGIGFGLQQIASNFISGLIILADSSLTVGDYIELEDGKAGILTKLNLRSSTLETFDGKTIVVPNERFITTTFTNWTHQDPRQRYDLEFSVAYNTDIRKLPKLIIDKVSTHPQVLQEPE